MVDNTRTQWVNLGVEGFDIVLASFEDSPEEKAIVIRGDRKVTNLESSALQRAGFFQMSSNNSLWARRGGHFKMRELRPIFPAIKAINMDISDTRINVRGRSPFISHNSTHDRLPEKFITENKKLDSKAVNQFQVVYKPASRLGNPIAMVPVNMSDATAKALDRIVETHGPIDNFVASSLDVTLHELEKYLSPEQIDAVGMGIAAMLRDREFILADQTGLGKGRVLAALALAARVMGKNVVFLTEKANLFADFWRDITDIGAAPRMGAPFLMNNNSKIIDVMSPTGEILFQSERPDVIKRLIRAGGMPEGHNMMMASYSQFNRAGSAKSNYLGSVAEGAFVLTDEAHNASGDSNTKKILDEALAGAYGVMRSSATFARKAKSLLSYKRVLPPSLRNEDVGEMLDAGGNPLAEALSQYLAEDGVLIRREHDLSGLKIDVIMDDARRERNRGYSDALAPILTKMAKLSRLVDDEINTRNDENERSGGKAAKEKWYTSNFGSRLSPLIRQFVTALEVDNCIERAVMSLQSGEKPVIVIESTMESLMRELSGEGRSDDDDFDETADIEITEEDMKAEGTRPPDFRAALSVMLDRIMQMSVKRGKEDPEKFPVEDPYCIAEAEDIRKLIESFPDLSLSPIDDIRDRIEAAGRDLKEKGHNPDGWTADEISARKMRVQNGLYEVRKSIDRNETIVAFNNGGIDALVITRAASTGLSLHASERVKDQRRRRMIELQIPVNVVERVQFWGRVNRRGQTSIPAFETLCTGLPLQMRIMAMENRKVAALSANVSANAENANAMDVPDLIDSVGNQVAQRILEDKPRLAEKMCIAMRNIDQEVADQELYYVNKLLQRMCMLMSDEQDELFAQLITEYEDAIASMKAEGKTPRGMRELEGFWKEVSREIYEEGNPDDGDVFGRPVELVTMEGHFDKNPFTGDKIQRMISSAREELARSSDNVVGPYFNEEIKIIRNNRKRILNGSLSARLVSVDFALKSKEPNAVKNADERLSNLQAILAVIQPGQSMTVPSEDSGSVTAVIVDVRRPDKDEIHLPGRWSVKFAIPGETHTKEISLATLIRDKAYALHPLQPGRLPEPNLKAFDNAPRGTIVETRQFLDGNLVKAVAIAAEARAGNMVIYYDDDGNRKRTVMLGRNGFKNLFDRNRKIKTGDEGVEIIKSNNPLYTNHLERSKGLTIVADGNTMTVSIPKNKDGKQFEDLLIGVCNFRAGNTDKFCRVPYEKMDEIRISLNFGGFDLHFEGNNASKQVKKPFQQKNFGQRNNSFSMRR